MWKTSGSVLWFGILTVAGSVFVGYGYINNTECPAEKVWRVSREMIVNSGNQSETVVLAPPCKTAVRPSMLTNVEPGAWQTYLQAFAQLMSELRWATAVLISDENTDMIVDRISQVLVDINCRFTHYVIRSDTSNVRIRDWINSTYYGRRHTGLHYLLMAEDHNVQRVIALAGLFDQLDKGKTALYFFSRWLVVSGPTGEEVVARNVGALDHVAVMSLHENGKERVQNESFSGQCPKYQKIDVGNCDTKGVNMMTVYYKPKGKVFCCIGVWSNQSLNLRGDVFPNVKFGFNNRTLVVGTNMWPPFVYRHVNSSVEFDGYTMELLREVANTLNFSYTLQVPEDMEWGAFRDGRWTGLVGDLYYDKVDLVAAPIAQTTFREKGCDFTYPYFYEFSVIIIRMPDPMGQKWRALLDIFSWPVMALVIGSLPLMALVVYFVEHLDPVPKNKQLYWPATTAKTYITAVWYLFGALLSQGGILNPKSISGRTLIGFWWLYCIVVTATFTGQLMATLTVTSVRPPFDDIAEMVQQEDYKWGTAGGGTVISVSLESSRDPVFQDVWKGILKFQGEDPEVLDPSIYTHFRKVQDGNYAYLSDKSGILGLLSDNCELKQLKEEFFPTQYAFALPEGSPFVDMFSERIFFIQESGLLKIWEKKWWPRNNCTGLPRTQALTMGMVDVQSAYYVLVIGIVLGMFALLIECFKQLIDRQKLRTPSSPVINRLDGIPASLNNSISMEMSNNDVTSVSVISEDSFEGMTYSDIDGNNVKVRQIKQPD